MSQQESMAAWLLGLFGTMMTAITLGWVGNTSKRTQDHAVKIAVLETDVKYIREGIGEIKEHLGIQPKE